MLGGLFSGMLVVGGALGRRGSTWAHDRGWGIIMLGIVEGCLRGEPFFGFSGICWEILGLGWDGWFFYIFV